MVFLSKQVNSTLEWMFNQFPGYFLLKDSQSTYIKGCNKTAKLFGFKKNSDLEGICDYDINCKAAEFANSFIEQDKEVLLYRKPRTFLDVHPYINGELKALLINKSLVTFPETNEVGIACLCTEPPAHLLQAIHLEHLKTKKHISFTVCDKAHFKDFNLSKRESECLFHLIRGKSCKEIGQILHLSSRTVETYVEQLKSKLSCRTKSEVIAKAFAHGYHHLIIPSAQPFGH